jgi:polyisoprenoid-binding protein YceI
MTLKSLLALLGIVLLASPAAAAHWKVAYSKSKVGFTVSWSGQPFSGSFKSWRADIDFDPADLAHSRAEISIDTGSETSGDAETDEGVKGAEGFQTTEFPTALFRTTSFTHKAGNDYIANGVLSIKGISKSIILPFTLTVSGATAHVVGKAQIVRTDFRVGTGEWAKSDPVSRDVSVNIDLVAVRTGS